MKDYKKLFYSSSIIVLILLVIIMFLGYKLSNSDVVNIKNDYKKSLASYEETINDKDEEIEKINKKIKSKEKEINELEDDLIKSNEEKDEILNSCSDSSCEEKLNLKTRIFNNKSKIYENKIKRLNNEISSLQSQVESLSNTFTVFYSLDNETVYTEVVKKGQNVKNVPDLPDNGDFHKEWSNDGKNVQSDMVIYGRYYYLISVEVAEEDATPIGTVDHDYIKVYSNNLKISWEDGVIKQGNKILCTGTISQEFARFTVIGWKTNGFDDFYTSYDDYEVTEDQTFIFSGEESCIAAGSKLQTKDGEKLVEDLQVGDKILSYNVFTGKLEYKRVSLLAGDTSVARVYTVKLENGNELQIVDYEYLFDTDAKKFISIEINTYKSAIGKNIMVNNNGEISSSKIESITLETKEVEHYTIFTEEAFSYVANGIVGISPFYYINMRYTIDDNYKIDQTKLNKDKEKYGVYTYEDLKDVCTEEVFNMYHYEDYKIIVEKGLVKFEDLKKGLKKFQDYLDYFN